MSAVDTKKGKEKPKEKHHWRENIEALSMAIIVALLFKYFILEISKIPSGSMQPTLMGNPQTGVFDRVLVDKMSFRFRDPKRFEIVVFKHPLERSRIMVKRLMGMPGEEMRIRDGDVFVRDPGAEEWTILRRPQKVQDELWKPLDPKDGASSSWSVVGSTAGWRISGRDVESSGEGRVRFRAQEGGVRNLYVDGYPDSLRNKIGSPPRTGQSYVGDLRFEGEIAAAATVERFTIELTEGDRTYEFRVPGPGADGAAVPEIVVRDSNVAEDQVVSADAAYRLPSGDGVEIAAQNLDDRLALEIDGEEVVSIEIEGTSDQRATLTLGLGGGGGSLSDLQVYRDTYYLPPDPEDEWTKEIPEGHYVMLGDNTQDSADSRDWKAVRMLDSAGEHASDIGNYRPPGQERPRSDHNPVLATPEDGEAVFRFRNRWGDVRWIPRSEAGPGLSFPSHLVPRELIQGRALCVFWPLKPHKGLWRLGWLH